MTRFWVDFLGLARRACSVVSLLGKLQSVSLVELSGLKSRFHGCIFRCSNFPGGNYIHPPPSPHFWPKGIFQGRGGGVYILSPHAAGILYPPPPFYTPPTPKRVFLGVGGWGCIKFGPVNLTVLVNFCISHRLFRGGGISSMSCLRLA